MTKFQETAKKYLNNNNISVALNFYKLDLYNNNFNKYVIYYNISNIYYQNKNYNMSLHYIKNSIRNNPNWYKSWYLLGEILFSMEKLEDSIRAYSHCNDLNIDIVHIKNKIITIKNKIANQEETDDSSDSNESNDSSDSTEYNAEEIGVNNSKKINYKNFVDTFNQPNIQNMLQNEDLQKKIINSNGNPMAIFKDKEIYSLMQNMYNEYKKK